MLGLIQSKSLYKSYKQPAYLYDVHRQDRFPSTVSVKKFLF